MIKILNNPVPNLIMHYLYMIKLKGAYLSKICKCNLNNHFPNFIMHYLYMYDLN